MSWRLAPHTADVAIEATAKTAGQALADGGLALTSLLVGNDNPRQMQPTCERAFVLEAPDLEALAVAVLSEWVWLAESEDLVWLGGGIDVTAGPRGWVANVVGNYHQHMSGEGQGVEVKAVTYHDLQFEQTGPTWSLRVLLDI